MRFHFCLLAGIMALSTGMRGQAPATSTREISSLRAVEGGGERVAVDTITSLPNLIKRLAGPWKLVETGKAYWIGYTDDMFSIAAHNEAAVEPLLMFLAGTNDKHAKEGAALTLHLIGINRIVVGRFEEKFIDSKARVALLSLIDDEQCGDLAVELLARDPWPSDVPKLVESLAGGKRVRNILVNALFRYAKGDTPFRQNIDEAWDTIDIEYRDLNGQRPVGVLKTVVRERKTDNPETINAMDRSDLILQWGKEGRILRKLIPNENTDDLAKLMGTENPTETLYNLFLLSKEKVSIFSFCDLGGDIWHLVETRRIVIVAPEIARQLWLEYFSNLGSVPNSK